MENKAPRKVFADDMALACRYWETVTRKNDSQPEMELMLAVLKDAFIVYKKYLYLGNALFREAETWFFDREGDRLFAFETVCVVLGLSAEKIRGELLTWKLNRMSSLRSAARCLRSDAGPGMEKVNFG